MKHRTFLKLLIDVAMCIVYLMLMFADGVGDFFHEAAGIGIGALFIIHILLNRSMTKGPDCQRPSRLGRHPQKAAPCI